MVDQNKQPSELPRSIGELPPDFLDDLSARSADPMTYIQKEFDILTKRSNIAADEGDMERVEELSLAVHALNLQRMGFDDGER